MGYGLPKRALRSRGAVLCGLLNLAPLFHIDLLSLLRKLSCGMGVFTTAPRLCRNLLRLCPGDIEGAFSLLLGRNSRRIAS